MPTVVQPVDVEPERASGFAGVLRKSFSFPVLMGALLVGGMFVAMRAFVLDPDAWWHVRVGETLLATHRVPASDPYSFTAAGTPWMAYEWLGDVALAVAHRAAGLQGLLALDIALGAVTLIALYALCTLRSRNSKAAFVASVVLMILAGVSYSLRPQMFGYLFLVLTLIALERFRQGKRWMLWLLPALFLVWVNTHGSFIIGLGAMGVYWASGLVDFRAGDLEVRRWSTADRRRLEWVALFCLIALTITPYGTRLAVYPFDMAFSQPLNVANIIEWQSMPFNLSVGKLFLALLIGFFVAQVVLRPTWRLEEMVLFLFGTLMACLHARFLLIFVPFFAPILATLLARWVPPYDRAKDKYALNVVLMALVGAGIVGLLPSRPALERVVAEHWPVDAVRYLRAHAVPGPMYNTYGFGGYLVYAQQKVFIDGRGDLYERAGVMGDYLHISYAEPGALAVLSGYGVKSCLLHRDEPLATLLSASPDWQQAYADKVSALFVRRSGLASHRVEDPELCIGGTGTPSRLMKSAAARCGRAGLKPRLATLCRQGRVKMVGLMAM